MSDREPRLATAQTLFLVSCVSKKRSAACRARDLYISDWFVKARAHVEATGSPWFILSAEFGLVDPDAVIAPYERTLNRMHVAERREWARRVLEHLVPKLVAVERVVLFAGERYRELLLPALTASRVAVDLPLQGLGIGEQLRWFKLRQEQRA
jgi:hypothetical protein